MSELPAWLRLWYRKPQWRDVQDYTRELNDKDIKPGRVPSPSPPSGLLSSVPIRLALDRVLENRTCSPMSLHDFYLYLQHIEHSAENLEFYLWYKNYEATYFYRASQDKAAVVTEGEVRPSTGRTDRRSEDSNCGISVASQANAAKASIESISDSILKSEPPCARLASSKTKWTDHFFRWSPSARTGTSERQLIENPAACTLRGTCQLDPADAEKGRAAPLPVATRLSQAPQGGGRAELDAAIARFLLPGAEKELNVSHSLRQRTLNKLQESSSPEHLKPVADHIYEVMKNCSHRNFVALGVSTGTYETICVGNLLGISFTLAGFLLVLLRALYPHIGAHSRWEVFCSFPLWAMGATLMLVGTQGMCFVMLSMSKRQALPWERFEEEGVVITHSKTAKGPMRWWRRYRSFMNRTVAHSKNFKVQDKHLRRLQRLILCQCISGGVGAALCGVLLFVFLPVWKETVR